MKKTIKYLFMILFVFSLPAFSQSAGTTVFEFLKISYSSRGAAMANNLIAVKGDVNSILHNPAALAHIEESQWSINYINYLLDLQAGHLAYAKHYQKWGTLAVGLIYFNYGNFDETDEFGQPIGRTFGATEFALITTIAKSIRDGFDYAMNLKFIHSSLESYDASAIAIDAGLLYTFRGVVMGASLANLGSMMDQYGSLKEKLPLHLRIGFSKRLAHLPLLFTTSFNDLTLINGSNLTASRRALNMLKRFSLGGEFDLNKTLQFRIGYDHNINRNLKPIEGRSFGGVSLGLGILWNQFRIDYALSVWGRLGMQNRLGVVGSL